jgi:hypothetical protein
MPMSFVLCSVHVPYGIVLAVMAGTGVVRALGWGEERGGDVKEGKQSREMDDLVQHG